MDIKKIDTSAEKLIITSLIVSDKYISNIYNIIDTSLLKLNYAKLLANWCLDYYKKYKKAPHKNIQRITEDNKISIDDETIKMILLFLEHINDNYIREEKFNEEYALDQSLKYLNQRKLTLLKQQIDEALQTGQESEAEKLVAEYKKIKLPIQDYTDVFSDIKVIDSVLNYEEEEIFSFSGRLGNILKYFSRGDLIAFAAPAKRGKTFLLIETAIQSVIFNNLRTVIFSLEMNKQKILKRIYMNVMGETKYEKEISIPCFVDRNKERNEKNKVKEEDIIYDIDNNTVKKAGLSTGKLKNKIKAIKPLLKGSNLRLFCGSPHSVTVSDISSILDNMVLQENFIADCVIIDFADIVKTEYKADQHRHKLNNVWENLRALALQKHCLVMTATHTNKQTFDRDMKQGDMSEDIRKINHVSMMLGLNQKAEEKKKNIARLVVLANREDDFNINNEIIVLQCLNIGKPILDCRLDKNVRNYSKK